MSTSNASALSSKAILDLSKLEPLDGHNYRRWALKIQMFFEQLEIDYVLFKDPPMPSVEQSPPNPQAVKTNEERIQKYEKDNKTARCHLLNHMTNTLFDLFMIHRSAKAIWAALESKYGGDDAGMKKYVVGKWLQFTLQDDKPIMDQVHVYENLCADVINEGMGLNDIFLANVLLEKFPPSWSEYRNHLKHKKKDLSLKDLVGHIRTEEANRLKDKSLKEAVPSVKANLAESEVAEGAGNKAGSSKNRPKGKKGGQVKAKNKGPSQKPSGKVQKPAQKITCCVCGKPSHKAYQCN